MEEKASSTRSTAAAVLDELSSWTLKQVAGSPIRTAHHDDVLARAAVLSNYRALEVFRTSRSFTTALHAGKEAFTEIAGSHSTHDVTPRTSRRSTPELWTEPRDGKGTATG